MESVETRKLGKHVFIFEKGGVNSSNGKVKERTLISSCQSDADNNLPPEFVNYMRTLFDILDTNNSGFVKLSDMQACWGKRNGDSVIQDARILEQLRKITPANGLLSFDRLCVGIGRALHSKEGVSLATVSTGLSYNSQKSSAVEQNSHSRPLSKHLPDGTFYVAKQAESSSCHVMPENPQALYNTIRTKENDVMGANFCLGVQRPEERPTKSTGYKPGEPKRTIIDLPFAGNGTSRSGLAARNYSSVRGTVSQTNKDALQVRFTQGKSRKSSKFEQKPVPNVCKTQTVVLDKPTRKRPKSMIPFSEQKRNVDLSVAKKKGGILEGIQNTDKKAVIDKLKQWRNQEINKNVFRARIESDVGNAVQSYQSDNDGRCRIQRRALHQENDSGFEQRDNPMYWSNRRNKVVLPQTTVSYQGQVQVKTTVQYQDENHRIKNIKDARSVQDELLLLKEGLHVVNEVRDCLVRRIADIQELKLYEQLNSVCPDNDSTKTKSQDINATKSEARVNIGKVGIVLDSARMQSLLSHFNDLRTILRQVKLRRNNR